MSARKDALKQSKLKDKEKIRSLIQNTENHWPDLTINEELLRNPTTDFVKAFYGRFYSEFEKITNDIRTNILRQDTYTDQTPYNDEIALGIKLIRICNLVGIPFNLNDICEPQPKRTVLYFTVLMNIFIFLKSNAEYKNDVVQCRLKHEHFMELKETKDSLIEEIQHLSELDIQLEQNILGLSSNIENLTKEHKDILVQKAERDFRHQQDFKVINKLQEDIKASDEHLSNLRNESTLLEEQIVSENEVDMMKNEIADLKKQLDNLNNTRINITSNLEDLEEKTKHYKASLVPLENPVFSSENLRKLKQELEKLTQLKEKISRMDEMNRLRRVNLKNLQGEYLNLQESLKNIQREFHFLENETGAEIVKMGQDLDNLVLKIKEDETILRSHENDIKNFEDIISILKQDISLVKSYFSSKYEDLVDKQEKIFKRFHDALWNISRTQSGIKEC